MLFRLSINENANKCQGKIFLTFPTKCGIILCKGKVFLTFLAKCDIILCKLTATHLGWREMIKRDKILTRILIFLGICGYVAVLSLTALEHSHCVDGPCHSESECAACFYNAHDVDVESHVFAPVSPAISFAQPPCSEAVILPLRLPYHALSRAPPVSS